MQKAGALICNLINTWRDERWRSDPDPFNSPAGGSMSDALADTAREFHAGQTSARSKLSGSASAVDANTHRQSDIG